MRPEYGPAPVTLAYIQTPGDRLELRQAWRTIRRNRWLLVGSTASMILLAGIVTLFQRPVYQSATTVQIETDDRVPSFVRDLSPILMAGAVAGSDLARDVAILQSRQLAAAVADSLALRVRLLDPTRPRSEVLQILNAPRGARSGEIEFRLRDDGTYTVQSDAPETFSALPARVRPGVPFRLGDVELSLVEMPSFERPTRIRVALLRSRDAAGSIARDLGVESVAPELVEIRYRSDDAELAAAVPNALIRSFVDYKTRTRKVEASGAVTFLRNQVAHYERQLRDAEAALRDFREQAQVVNPQEESSVAVRRRAELQARRDERLAERQALASLLQHVTKSAPAPEGQRSPYRQLASYPAFLSNPAVQNILQNLVTLENERADLLVRRTAESVDVQGIDSRIEELELQLLQTARSYLSSLDNELASLNTSLARFGGELEAVPAREVEFARLTRQQALLEQLYTLLQTQLKEREIQEALELGDVQVIDEALTPEKPISPKPTLNLLAGAMLGLVFGVVGAFLRNSLDTTVRTREDVRAVTAGLPIMGMIPRLHPLSTPRNGRPALPLRGGTHMLRRPPGAPSAEHARAADLVAQHDPRSPAAEAFRALRTDLLRVGTPPAVLVFTSATAGDGKSVSASNLAVTLAQQGVRTLLVDADLRDGALHEAFSLAQRPGLTEVLHGMALARAVQTLDADGFAAPLHFLSTGALPANPAEMLGTERMQALISELRAEYEAVIFDTPPLNLVTDAAVLGGAADVVILVTRVGVTEREALELAAGRLQRIGAAGGVLLNDIDLVSDYYGDAYARDRNGTAPEAAPTRA